MEAYFGPLGADGLIAGGHGKRISFTSRENGIAVFQGRIPLENVGHTGMTVRVYPTHPDLAHPFEMNRVTYAQVGAGEG